MQIDFSLFREDHNQVLFLSEHQAEGLREKGSTDFLMGGDRGVSGKVVDHILGKNKTSYKPFE